MRQKLRRCFFPQWRVDRRTLKLVVYQGVKNLELVPFGGGELSGVKANDGVLARHGEFLKGDF